MTIIINAKQLFAMIFTFLCGVYAPVKDFMVSMVFLFFLNFLAGLIADIAQGGRWENKKARQCFTHMFVFFGLVFFMVLIGHFMHEDRTTLQVIHGLCFSAIYYFAVNIIRNGGIITEGSTMGKVFKFAYYVMTIQFIEQFPLLKKYEQFNKEESK